MDLNQVKQVIFQTEFRKFVLDGLCCSEPIMTKDKKGVIDNYFIYGEDWEANAYLGATIQFGIYSEMGTAAYVTRLDTGTQAAKMEGQTIPARDWGQNDVGAYRIYFEAFPKVRGFLFSQICSDEEVAVLKRYLQAMQSVVDPALWPVYRERIPAFFLWADKLCERRA